MSGVADLVKFSVPGGTRGNLRYMEDKVGWAPGVTENEKLVLADAQTSGGLLIAVHQDRLEGLLKGLAARGVETRAVIGRVTEGDAGKIFVER
jgi:selenide,water dikinase